MNIKNVRKKILYYFQNVFIVKIASYINILKKLILKVFHVASNIFFFLDVIKFRQVATFFQANFQMCNLSYLLTIHKY